MELPAGDEPAVDEELPQGHICRGIPLGGEGLVQVGLCYQSTLDEQVAEARLQADHANLRVPKWRRPDTPVCRNATPAL